MLARSHVGIGMLGGIFLRDSLSLSIIPAAILLILFNVVPGMARYILFAILAFLCITYSETLMYLAIPLMLVAGSLFPDLDHPNSTGSMLIAPTQNVLRVLIGVAGITLGYFTYPSIYGIVGGILLIATAVLNVKWYPAEKIQRLMLLFGGFCLIAFDTGMFGNIFGFIYVSMGVLSHRGLTHSTEGFLFSSMGVWLWAHKIGHSEFIAPFLIGYALHLLADMITDSGIYISYFAKIKFGIPLIKTSGMTDRLISVTALALSVFLLAQNFGIVEKIIKVVS